MKRIFVVLFALTFIQAKAQKLHTLPGFEDLNLHIPATIFDPNLDSTIQFVEFWQDTSRNYNNSDQVYAVAYKREGLEKAWSIGTIGNYQVDKKHVAVIIKVYRPAGVEIIIWEEKIDKLQFYKNFDYAEYSIDVNIFSGDEENGLQML